MGRSIVYRADSKEFLIVIFASDGGSRTMNGYTGKILRVDLNNGSIVVDETVPESWWRQYLGGAGLAARIFFEEVPTEVEPLDPDNPLIFMNGILTGTSFPGSGRFSVCARSPLTGIWGECNCGGSFGPALKLAGYDGIIFKGKSNEPIMLVIEGDQVELKDASGLWGLDTYECHQKISQTFSDRKKQIRTMQIGQAGENLSNLACITNEIGSVAGRCGLGAVMGSKNLKAVAVIGGGKMSYANPEKSKEVVKATTVKVKTSMFFDTLHDLGTNGALDSGMLSGDVPVKNWAVGEWLESLDTLNSFYCNDNALVKGEGCYACPMRCKRVVSVKEEKYYLEEAAGPEYETVCMLGTNVMNSSYEAVCKANDMCNRFGLDTIGTGAVIAMLMEAQEMGIVSPDDTGLDFSWGNADTILKSIELMAKAEGFGKEMGKGSRSLSEKLGKGCEDLAVQVKGLDLPAHDPRGFHGYGLAYAMSIRGGCHLTNTNLMIEGGMASWPEVGFKGPYKGMKSKGKAALTSKCISVAQVLNALTICQFASALMNLTDQLEMLKATTGWEDFTIEEYMDCGYRIWYLKRALLNLYGVRKEDDNVPKKILTPTQEGTNAGSVPKMKMMLEEFYEMHQLDDRGVPSRSALEKYSLGFAAERIEKELV